MSGCIAFKKRTLKDIYTSHIHRRFKNVLSVADVPLLLLLPQRCSFMFCPQDGENLKF